MNLQIRGVSTIGFVLLVMSLAACSGLRELSAEIGDLNGLQKKLQQQTGQSAINVNLNNGNYLNISFVNSPLAKLQADQKKAKALEVARFAYNDWPKRAELVTVTVIFLSSYDVGSVHYSNSTDNFSFPGSDLAASNMPIPTAKTPGSAHQ